MIKPLQCYYMGHCKVCNHLDSLHFRDDEMAGGICDDCKEPLNDAELWLLNEGLLRPTDNMIWRNP